MDDGAAPGGPSAADGNVTFAGLHHVQLAIPPGGEEQARAFYAGVLGLREVDKPPVLAARGGCWFRGDGWEVHLGVEDPFVPARKAHPGVLVQGLDALAARLAAHGSVAQWDGEFPGHRRIYAHDLHGNRLEFLESRPSDAPAGLAGPDRPAPQ